MKHLLATIAAFGLFASAASACDFHKTADHGVSTMTTASIASDVDDKTPMTLRDGKSQEAAAVEETTEPAEKAD